MDLSRHDPQIAQKLRQLSEQQKQETIRATRPCDGGCGQQVYANDVKPGVQILCHICQGDLHH
jgi:hypothetical protein